VAMVIVLTDQAEQPTSLLEENRRVPLRAILLRLIRCDIQFIKEIGMFRGPSPSEVSSFPLVKYLVGPRLIVENRKFGVFHPDPPRRVSHDGIAHLRAMPSSERGDGSEHAKRALQLGLNDVSAGFDPLKE
jgi:hypothetical protein